MEVKEKRDIGCIQFQVECRQTFSSWNGWNALCGARFSLENEGYRWKLCGHP